MDEPSDHIAAATQIRLDTPGRAYYRRKLAAGKTRAEAMRCLKRRISDAIYRSLDRRRTSAAASADPGGQCGASPMSSAADLPPHEARRYPCALIGESQKPLAVSLLGSSMRPCSDASAVALVRLPTPSLARIRETCTLAVFGDCGQLHCERLARGQESREQDIPTLHARS